MSYAYRLSLRNGWRTVWEYSENKKKGTFGAEDLRLKLGQLRQNKRSCDMDPFYQHPGRKSIRLEEAYEGEDEDETFRFDIDVISEVEQMMDRVIDDALDKLAAEKDGKAMRKIREVPSINLHQLDRMKFFSTKKFVKRGDSHLKPKSKKVQRYIYFVSLKWRHHQQQSR